jgi:hypothetical protein
MHIISLPVYLTLSTRLRQIKLSGLQVGAAYSQTLCQQC